MSVDVLVDESRPWPEAEAAYRRLRNAAWGPVWPAAGPRTPARPAPVAVLAVEAAWYRAFLRHPGSGATAA